MKKVEKEYVLGILGGMGTYATIHLFKQYAEIFPAKKEWDRPRIIIDNNCTMPSRVRAILYNENRSQLVEKMNASIHFLIGAGATQIILGCNTSHLFLDEIYKRIPESRQYIIDMIDLCVAELQKRDVHRVYLLATEGTIASGIYQHRLNAIGINCVHPAENEFDKLRHCIEAVKQNLYSNEVKKIFLDFVHRDHVCILGCTELPILYDKYKNDIMQLAGNSTIFNPLYLALQAARRTYLSVSN